MKRVMQELRNFSAPHTGVICAILTPFVSEFGHIDDDWFPAHLRFLESHGMHGVLALGTTGEGPSLSMQERKHVLDIVLNHRGNLFVFAGTGCAALPETIELSRYALEQGVDGVLVMPPFYFKTVSDKGVLQYYRALCDELPNNARLLLYHIPVVTGVPITPPIIEGLLDSHSNQFYGIKDSSGDPQHIANLIKTYPQLHIYSGSDTQVANAFATGATGAISAFSNVWPHLVRAVFDAHQSNGDVATAQERLTKVRQAVPTAFSVPSALKAALPWTSGLPRTSVRVPLANLSESEVAMVQNGLNCNLS